MRKRERGDDQDQRAHPPERNHQAEEKQQVIGAIQDVEEAEADKPERGLAPAGIETDKTDVSVVLEAAHRAVRRQEPQHGERALAEAGEPGIDREPGCVRPDWVLDKYVDQPLAPEQLFVT